MILRITTKTVNLIFSVYSLIISGSLWLFFDGSSTSIAWSIEHEMFGYPILDWMITFIITSLIITTFIQSISGEISFRSFISGLIMTSFNAIALIMWWMAEVGIIINIYFATFVITVVAVIDLFYSITAPINPQMKQ